MTEEEDRAGDPIVENGGWTSREEAEAKTRGGSLVPATFLGVGALLSVRLGFVSSSWWWVGSVGLGSLAVYLWWRARRL